MDEDEATHGTQSSSTPTSICTLPNELLIQIFCWVCLPNLCTAWDSTNDSPKFSTALALVCSRWRHLMRDMPFVLSHIDLFVHRSNDPKYLALTKTYLTRAKQVPLDIHIIDRAINRRPALTDFCKILDLGSPRMRSLTFQQEVYSQNIGREVFNHCLGRNLPGVLKELNIVTGDHGRVRVFIEAGDSVITHSYPPIVLSHITADRLEAIFLSIETLRLCGEFPYWTSSAYCGLVELCLHSKRDRTHTLQISQSSLWRILLSSPKLQVLDLNLNLIDLSASTAVPIHLDDLQVIRTGSMAMHKFGYLLKFLFPGPKPLTLCCRGYRGRGVLAGDTGITAFLGRTNVERIWFYPTTSISALELLAFTPHIRELALSQLTFASRTSSASRFSHRASEANHKAPDHIHSLGPIDVLYLLPPCEIDIITLKYMMRSRIRKFLVHHKCVFTVDDLPVSPSTLEEQLADLYPDFEWLYEDEPPHWRVPSFPGKV